MVNNTDTSYNIIVTYDSNSELFYFSGNDETEVELINQPKNTLYFKTNSAIYFDLSFSSNNDISFVISNFNDNIIDEGSNGSTLEISSNSYVFYKFGSTNVTNNSSGVIEIFSTTILNRENLVDILNKKKNIIDDPNTISDTQKFNTDKRRFLGNFNYIVSDNRNLVTDSSGIVDDMIIESITSDLHLVTTDDRKIHFWSGETIVEENLIIKGNLVMDYNKLGITIINEISGDILLIEDNIVNISGRIETIKTIVNNLDISYVTDVAFELSYNDLSNLYASKSKFNLLELSLNNYVTKTDIDASLSLYSKTSDIDASFALYTLSTNLYTKNALESGNLDLSFNNIDISGNLDVLGNLDVAQTLKINQEIVATKNYIDSSFTLLSDFHDLSSLHNTLNAQVQTICGSNFALSINTISGDILIIENDITNISGRIDSIKTIVNSLDISYVTDVAFELSYNDLSNFYASKSDLTLLESSLNNYVTQANIDASFTLYSKTTDIDASFALYSKTTDIDASFALYSKTTDIDASFALYTPSSELYTKTELQSGNLDLSFNNVEISGNLDVSGTITSSSPYYLRMGYDTDSWADDNNLQHDVTYVLPWNREQNGYRGYSTAPTTDTPGSHTWKPSIPGYYMVTARVYIRAANDQIKTATLSMQRNYSTHGNIGGGSAGSWDDMIQNSTRMHNSWTHSENPTISTIVQVTDTKYSYRWTAKLTTVNAVTSTTAAPLIIQDFTVTGVEIYKFV